MQRKGEKSLALCRYECLRHVGVGDGDVAQTSVCWRPHSCGRSAKYSRAPEKQFLGRQTMRRRLQFGLPAISSNFYIPAITPCCRQRPSTYRRSWWVR